MYSYSRVHVSTNGKLINLILEGCIEGVRDKGRQRRTWGDDVKEWTRTTTIGEAKRIAENREEWSRHDCVIVGGMDMVSQGKELSHCPHVVISTPGRLADHLDSCDTFTLKKIKYLVLDEADRLLEPGKFGDQLQSIFSALPTKRQTLLFSATITKTLNDLKEVSLQKPYFWESETDFATVEQLNQQYVLCPASVKKGYLINIIQKYEEENPNSSIIVFTSKCKLCQILFMMLNDLGFQCVALHSMISQKERLASLSKFKSNVSRILIATDVASRGLDIPAVGLVINHNIPHVAKDYIHRVGRTARAGRAGKALTLITQNDINLLHSVEDLIGLKLTEFKVNEEEVLKILTQAGMAEREAEIKLDEMNFGEKQEINKRKKQILDELDGKEIKKSSKGCRIIDIKKKRQSKSKSKSNLAKQNFKAKQKRK
ncbi:putative ATP-dependent RNA helicase DDX49 [Nymphon striatum]|nr:putative ATP-dependent RNA helicase DDX49 [Nymphon striatum]